MKRLLKLAIALVVAALVCGAVSLAWWWFYMLPRVERYPDFAALAGSLGPAPADHHYEVAVDLIDALPQAAFETPHLAAAAGELSNRLDARLDLRAHHVLARLVTLGSSAYLMYERRAIHLPTPGAVRYRVTMPAGARLSGEIGVLDRQNEPVEFSILVDGEEVLRRTERSLPPFRWNEKHIFYVNFYQWWRANRIDERKSRWVAFRVDLSRFANREVTLEFRTRSKSGAAMQAFIASPLVLGRKDGPPRPFIVYVNDGCNIPHLGAYGSTDGLTPHVDAFAKQGARVDAFVAGGNWSRPGVTTLLTGRPAPELFIPTAPSREPLPAVVREAFEGSSIDTLPIAFRRAGYRAVAAINNIFIVPSTPYAVDLGFNELTQTMRPDISTFDVAHFIAVTLSEYRDENVFLFIHQNAPNPVDHPPQRFVTQARPIWKARYADNPGLLDYLASLAFADFMFRQFLDMLDRLNLSQTATVVFTADHGQTISPAHDIKTPDKPGILRRSLFFHGQTLYDEELLIPGLIRGPGVAPGISIPGQHLSLALYPTLLDLARLPIPPGLHTGSLARALRGEAATAPDRFVFAFGKYSACLRLDNRLKYIRWTDVRRQARRDGLFVRQAVREELFDLASDPRELHDLAAERRDLLQQARDAFAAHVYPTPLVWALTVPDKTADRIVITGAQRVAVASGGEARPLAADTFLIEPAGLLRAAIFRLPGETLRVELTRQGRPLSAADLRFGAAFVQPPAEGFVIAADVEPPDAFTAYLPPAPDGVPRPHLCLMEWTDWAAQVPATGEIDPAVKDMLKKWGYTQ